MGTDVLWARVYISFQCMTYGRNMIIGCMEIGLRNRNITSRLEDNEWGQDR